MVSEQQYQQAVLSALTKWTIVFGLPVAALNLLGYAVTPVWTTPVGSGVVVVLSLIVWWCRRQMRQGRVQRAARVYLASGMLLMTLIIFIATKPEFLIGAMGLSVFVVIATFFSTPRAALLWGLLSAALYAGALLTRQLIGSIDLGSGFVMAILYVTPPIVLFHLALIGRIMNQHLLGALEQSEAARRALAQSHAEVERRVEERTRDLLEERNRLDAALHDLAIARDQAEAANRAKSHFLANMSHELRTPLTAILGYSELLLNEEIYPGSVSNQREIKAIWAAGQHLLALISNILDLSKIEADKLDLYLEAFDVAGLIEDVTTTIQPLVEKKGNRLKIAYAGDLGMLKADETRVKQVLFNVLSNAAKFTEQGLITLSAARETRDGAEWITFQVADTGIGIAPEYLPRLFEAFGQADASTTRRYGGSGLGLALSRHFCRLMGGEITLDSRLGQGTTVIVWLPV